MLNDTKTGTPVYDSLTEAQKQEVTRSLPVFTSKKTLAQLEALVEILAKGVKDKEVEDE